MLYSLLGVMVGWFLAEISYILRLRKEDKKKLKKALFNLMDVYFYLTKPRNVNLAIDGLFERVKKRFPIALTNPIGEQIIK